MQEVYDECLGLNTWGRKEKGRDRIGQQVPRLHCDAASANPTGGSHSRAPFLSFLSTPVFFRMRYRPPPPSWPCLVKRL